MLVGGIMWLKAFSFTQRMVDYTGLFSNIGGLQSGDPVTVNGLRKGTVARIELRGALVAVHFRLDSDVYFTDSCRVTVKNVGLMGERKIDITLSDRGTRRLPNERGKVREYIRGGFDSGIAEALGMLGDFMADASALVEDVSTILEHTLGNDEFIDFWDRTVVRLDTIVEVVDRLLQGNDANINHIVRDLRSTTRTLDNIVVQNRAGINSIVSNTDTLTDRAANLMFDLDSLLADLKSITSKIDTGDGSIGSLLNDGTTMEELMATIAVLDTLLSEVRVDGLRLRARIGPFGAVSERRHRRATAATTENEGR